MGKIHVYHHNDHDGIIAAGILYNHHIKDNIFCDEDFSFHMIDYDTELNFDNINTGDDQVYFLDYSFSNEHNLKEFKKLLDRRKNMHDIIWIDHHKTSIGLFEEYEIPGIRNTALCGAAWTYLKVNGILSRWIKNNVDLDKDASKLFHFSEYKIPLFLKFIDDYDCWKKIYLSTNDFHYGLQISSPKDLIISKLLNSDSGIEDIASIGEQIQEYLKFENREYHINMYGFEYTLPEEHGGLKCFCINRKGNSIMFGDKINKYDAVIPFFYINGKWKYSIFSNKDNIDCSQIAKTYGGGGHKGAAGWITDKLIFEDINSR